MAFGYTIIAVSIVSLISFIGVLTIIIKKVDNLVHLLVSFAAGSLLAAAFLDLIPESIGNMSLVNSFYFVLSGFFLFFLLEKFFHWRHCHEEECREHPFTYLSLLGDSIHNFFDGMIISASFISSYSLGLVTTLAVIVHEIPQELGDFAVLIHGGFTRKKAVLWNFLVSLTAFIGALIVYLFRVNIDVLTALLPFAAGGFIYIAASDLIPEMHKEKNIVKSLSQIFAFIAGIVLISLLITFFA